MKTSKGYSWVTQFLVLPIVTTGLLMFLMGYVENHVNRWLGSPGRYASDLVNNTITLGILLLSSMLLGLAFDRINYKRKPDTPKDRYLALIKPMLYSAIALVIVLVFSLGNQNSGWWGLYVLKNPLYFFTALILLFNRSIYLLASIELTALIGFTLGVFINEKITNTTVKDSHSLRIKQVFLLLCIGTLVYTGITSKATIANGYIELKYGKSTLGNELTEYDLYNIAPFINNNGLAKLDGTASLQLTEFSQMPRLDGATAAYPVYAAFVEAVYKGLGDYREENRNNYEKDIHSAFVSSDEYPFDIVKCSKTPLAYERLIKGETDIIFVAEPSKAHLEAVKNLGDEFVLTPIAKEAFVFFTNIKNPVEDLTISEIQGIYSGKITNWRDIGGKNRKIIPYQRPENSGSQTTMVNKVMKGLEMLQPSIDTNIGGMGEIISKVSTYQNGTNAIGYSFLYYSSEMIKNNQIKYIAIDGVMPTPETIRDNSYPFTVDVYAVTLKSNYNDNIDRFIQWILSEEGQQLIEGTGYIPF